MEWGKPENLIWFWLLPAAAVVFAAGVWRRRSALSRFGERSLVASLTASLNPRARFLKKIMLMLVICLMVTALTQPHLRTKQTFVHQRGIDVIIAVDVSESMLAKDIAPSRLEKAKLELQSLIQKLRGNRIGIVAFAGDAMIQCPLTMDYSAVKLFLSTVSPDLISYQGTSLARAIDVSRSAFAEKEKDHKAVVLLTDGENHEPEAEAAAYRAAKDGVRIFTVGIGTPDGSILPGDNPGEGSKRDRSGHVIISKLNESLLRDISHRTQGAYFRASHGDFEVDRLAAELSRMKQKDLKNDWSAEYEENFQFFLLAAVILLLLEMLFSERRRDRHE